MAQSKSFFGLRRGSTKSLTFSVYNGKQVTKDRVTEVKNPRSNMQMEQRAFMVSALKAYSAMKEICNHSFEGLAYGQKSMNYFVSENARMIRSAAPNVNLSNYKSVAVSNPYIIAKGSLPPIVPGLGGSVGKSYFTKEVNYAPATLTFGQLMSSFGANLVGDMVTFALLVDNPEGNASFYWLRLTLSNKNKNISLATSSETPLDVLSKLTEGVDFETNIDNFTTNDFPLMTEISYSVTVLNIGKHVDDENPVSQSLGIIVSRKSDTGWLRSSSTMVNLYDTYNYAEALATYPESGEKILNGGNV